MALDAYGRQDIANVLCAVAVAHGPMSDEATQVLQAVALAFGIGQEANPSHPWAIEPPRFPSASLELTATELPRGKSGKARSLG